MTNKVDNRTLWMYQKENPKSNEYCSIPMNSAATQPCVLSISGFFQLTVILLLSTQDREMMLRTSLQGQIFFLN